MGSFDHQLRVCGNASDKRGSFALHHDGVAIEVSYETDHDFDPVSVTLWLGYDRETSERAAPLDGSGYRDASELSAVRPMQIHLRSERQGDRAAVERGLSREWQAGDAEFDRAVYVDSPTSDPRVLAAVLGPSARAAVLRLLQAGIESVDIDDKSGRIAATRGRGAFEAGAAQSGKALEALDAFVALTRSLPRVVHSGGAHARAPLAGLTKVLGWVGVLGWSLNVGLAGAIALLYNEATGRTFSSVPAITLLGPLVLSIAGGIGCAIAYRAEVASRARGRSNAHVAASDAALSAFGGFSVLLFVTFFSMSLLYFAP